MKTVKLITHLILFLIYCFTFLSACKEKDPRNPCEGYMKPIANFLVQNETQMEYGRQTGITLTCDTLTQGPEHYFTSILDYDVYKWEILDNPNFLETTKSFKLRFDKSWNLTVRLIGSRKPNTTCDPTDDGVDTIIRKIVVVKNGIANNGQDTIGSPLWFGKYVGYDSKDPNTLVGMEVAYEKPSWSNSKLIVIKHFPDSCTHLLQMFNKTSPNMGYGGYNITFIQMHNNTGGGTIGCQSPNAWFLYNHEGIDIQYTTKDLINNGPEIKRRFTGKRIK